MVNNKGYKTHHTDHVAIKLTSFCVTLHCTNYPRPLRLSLTGSQALRLLQRLWHLPACISTRGLYVSRILCFNYFYYTDVGWKRPILIVLWENIQMVKLHFSRALVKIVTMAQ